MILSHDEARAFYDRFGAKQDLQRFYEDPAIEALLVHADFESATAVVELGCGPAGLPRRCCPRAPAAVAGSCLQMAAKAT